MTAAAPLRIVFAGVGSRGDAQPMVALAMRAKARGHDVVVAAPVNFRDWVEGLGLAFAPCGVDMQKFLANDPRALTGRAIPMMLAIRDAVTEHTPPQLNELIDACRAANALVWGGIAVSAPTAAEAAGIASINVMYSTSLIPSAQHPPPIVHWYGLPAWMNRGLWKVNDWLGARMLGRVVNPLRASLGLPACNVQDQVFTEGCHVIAADEQLFPSDPEWDRDRYPRANFIFFDDARPLDAELDAWLRDGPAPVFAGFGSMSGRGPKRATRAFIDAMAGSGHRCLIGAGWSGVDEKHLPEGWRIAGDVPHAKLFPRVAVVIHHGGSGTTASALRAGTPQVILPLLLDQYHHAHLLHRAGIAPRPTPMESVTAAALARAVDEALRLPEGPRLAIAQRLRASDGGAAVLDLVERKCAAA